MKWETLKTELMKDSAFREQWEALELPYQVIKMIVERRHALKLTQEELARRVGMKQSAIARIETGKHQVSLATLARIAKGLDVDIEISLRPRS